MLCLKEGKLVFDIGWVGKIEGTTNLADGKDHFVCLGYKKDDGKYFIVCCDKEEASGLHAIKDKGDSSFMTGVLVKEVGADGKLSKSELIDAM